MVQDALTSRGESSWTFILNIIRGVTLHLIILVKMPYVVICYRIDLFDMLH